ncbi:MAG: hypothetical protein ACK58L_14285 [Planctomycetota bacterium]
MRQILMLTNVLSLYRAICCGLLLSYPGETLDLAPRYQRSIENGKFERLIRNESWASEETAIIVCDVWDKHHCLNAVRRMEEFLPRMNDVLEKARGMGVVIIHAPSDCMPAYDGTAARRRAIEAPQAGNRPTDVEFWCSSIPAEEQAAYPIDQSDGGEDDDPEEHARWAAELKGLGRNPSMPWRTQSDLIRIDQDKDYVSDRGDEVWNILESRRIHNVILVGVHTNMCVLGRPFGLRQMARNGKRVVLMRDLTDCMYNPKRWPYVDHFTGNDLVISHVERFVCPTITSDQIVGGQPFVSKSDTREARDVVSAAPSAGGHQLGEWKLVDFSLKQGSDVEKPVDRQRVVWLRCSLRLPSRWVAAGDVSLNQLPKCSTTAWLNGKLLGGPDADGHLIPRDAMAVDDINLLTLRVELPTGATLPVENLAVRSSRGTLFLNGRWQMNSVDDPANSNIPLPAKFGMGPDVLHEPDLN